MGQTETGNAVNLQQKIMANATTQVQKLASMGMTASELYNESPDLYKSIIAATGMSDYELSNYMISQMPAAYQPQVIQTYTPSSDGNSTVINRMIIDPNTGQKSTESFTINMPYNLVNPKAFQQIGSNLYYQDSKGNLTLLTPQFQSASAGSVIYNTTTGEAPTVSQQQASQMGYGGFNSDGSINATYNPSTLLNPSGGASWSDFQLGATASADLAMKQSLQSEGVTPDELKSQAWLWLANGGKPPSGSSMSGGGVITKNAIAAAGAQLQAALGISTPALTVIAANEAGYTKTINTQISYMASVQGFEGTAENLVNTIINTYLTSNGQQTIDPSNSAAINKFVQDAENNLYGQAGLTAVQNYVNTLSSEYAKVMSGSTGAAGASDAATAKSEALVNTYMNKGQFFAALQAMQNDMKIRLSALQANLNTSQTNLINNVMTTMALDQASNAGGFGGSSNTNNSSSENNSNGQAGSGSSTDAGTLKYENGKWG